MVGEGAPGRDIGDGRAVDLPSRPNPRRQWRRDGAGRISPQALTYGPDRATTLVRARDALHVALAYITDLGEEVPPPSKPRPGQPTVAVSAMAAAKLAINQGMRELGLSQRALGERLGLDEKQIRRLLDVYYNSRWYQVERAMQAVGRGLVLEVARVPKLELPNATRTSLRAKSNC